MPLYIAYASVTVAGALALWVATMRGNALAPAFGVALMALLLCLVVVSTDRIAKRHRMLSQVPMRTVSPNWLIAEVTEQRPGKHRQCAAEFSTIGHRDDG